MKKYLSFFRIRFIAGLQYRAAAWAGIATQFAWGGMTILMFWAFYQNSSNVFPMEFQALSSYIWLQQALLAMFMAWFFDNEIFDSITSGSVAYELCRPCGVYTMWFVKNIAIRLSKVVLRYSSSNSARAFWNATARKSFSRDAFPAVSDGWFLFDSGLFHADLYFHILHDLINGYPDSVLLNCGVLLRGVDPNRFLSGDITEGNVCPALCFHAEYAFSNLHRVSEHTGGIGGNGNSACLVSYIGVDRDGADETCLG